MCSPGLLLRAGVAVLESGGRGGGGLLRGRSLHSIGDSDEAKSCKVMNTAHHGACRECREKTALGSCELGRGQEGHWTGR